MSIPFRCHSHDRPARLPVGHRRAQPILEPDLADSRVSGRNQGQFAKFCAEISRIWVGDHFARIIASEQTLADKLVEVKSLGPATSTTPFSGLPVATFATEAATSSAAMGWMNTGGTRTLFPSVASSAIPCQNSKNWVAWTIEYGIPDRLMSFSRSSLARIYGVFCRRAAPTTESAT